MLNSDQMRLMEQHTPIVKKLAFRMSKGLPANVDYDDLVQDGMLGLIDAILRTTKSTLTCEFEHYLVQRSRGAMIDGLRANDIGSRLVRQKMKKVELVIQRLEHQFMRTPRESEIAHALAMPLNDYQQLLQESQNYVLISLDDIVGDDIDDVLNYLDVCQSTDNDPFAMLERLSLWRTLSEALQELPEQAKMTIRFYYQDEKKMRQIGEKLGLSESRVSQIHTQAIATLRARIIDESSTPTLLKPRRKAWRW